MLEARLLIICRSNSKLGTIMHSLPRDATVQIEAEALASKLDLSLPTSNDRQALQMNVLCLEQALYDI